MIKFFRRIRQSLLSENPRERHAGKFSRYLLYAIGEIVLVVIGILIALQINEWNDVKKAKKAEIGVLQDLKEEFKSNQKELFLQKEVVSKAFDANNKLMSLFNKEKSYLLSKNIDSLIFFSVEFDRYSPTENVLQDLLQSGRLALVSNDSLRSLLFDWTRVLKVAEERYIDCNSKLDNEITVYLSRKYVFKDVDQYGNLKWKNKSEFKIDKTAVFSDMVYENLTDDFMYRLDRYLLELKKLETIINKIQEQIHD
ncbi:MAG: DUF6090 family protein [Bacteroidota bacterium]